MCLLALFSFFLIRWYYYSLAIVEEGLYTGSYLRLKTSLINSSVYSSMANPDPELLKRSSSSSWFYDNDRMFILFIFLFTAI